MTIKNIFRTLIVIMIWCAVILVTLSLMYEGFSARSIFDFIVVVAGASYVLVKMQNNSKKAEQPNVNLRNIVVYVSGKYSGDIETNIAVAKAYASKIWGMGFTAICPHGNTSNFEKICDCTYDDYIEGDLVLLSRSNVIFMLPGWEESQGANIEFENALQLGMGVFQSLPELEQFKQKLLLGN